MAVILIVVLLGTTLVVRTVSNLHSGGKLEDFTGALGDADAGLSDALFRIDQLPTGPGVSAPTAFCVTSQTPAPGDCTVVASSVPGAPGVEYKATPLNTASGQAQQYWMWKVQSRGWSHGVAHAVQALVTHAPQFPYALFGNSAVTLNGNSSGPHGEGLQGYSSAPPQSAPSSTAPVAIGSNGGVNCNGSTGGNVTIVYYSGGGGVSSCSGDAANVADPVLNYLKTPTMPASGTCLLGSSTLDGTTTTQYVPAGTYLCEAPVTLSGNIIMSGQVKLYIESASTTDTTDILDIAPGSCIYGDTTAGHFDSAGSTPCGGTGTPVYPIAADLQIYANGAGAIGQETGNGFTLGGIVDAPNGYLTNDGCKSVYYGSVVANTITCNGGANLTVNYDSALQSVVGPWQVGNYTEIGSNITL